MRKKKTLKKQFNLDRAPIVVMLGHVDHGKTSILDAIRGTKVQSCEAGGITQKVRAHQASYKTKKGEDYQITFIDTPGHKAFSEMRSRGAQVTDIVVLVVAIDDGVQPQTKEAVKYAKKAKVPIIVALNKIDLKGFDKNKVLQQLSKIDVQVEKLGGETICVEISAKKKTGINELLETILLVSEMNEIKKARVRKGIGHGVVLESTTDKSLGPISLSLIKSGKIQTGNFATESGKHTKIRAIKDEKFCSKASAIESEPVWLVGFDEEIPIGSVLYFYSDLKDIKLEQKKETAKKAKVKIKVTKSKDEEEEEELGNEILARLLEPSKKDQIPQLKIILKSESQGTLEVALKELEKLSSKEVDLKIVSAKTGEITKSDILMANDTNGIVIGYQSKLSNKDAKIAKAEKILVANYDIIYELLDEIAEVIESMQKPKKQRVIIAKAEIKKVFELTNGNKVAGCKVTEGTVIKGYQCYVEKPSQKKSEEVEEGKITSLRCKKAEIKEAVKGTECGILLDPQLDVEKQDTIVCFKIEKIK